MYNLNFNLMPKDALFLGVATDDEPVLVNDTLCPTHTVFCDILFDLSAVHAANATRKNFDAQITMLSSEDTEKILAFAAWVAFKYENHPKEFLLLKDIDKALANPHLSESISYVLNNAKKKAISIVATAGPNFAGRARPNNMVPIEKANGGMYTFFESVTREKIEPVLFRPPVIPQQFLQYLTQHALR